MTISNTRHFVSRRSALAGIAGGGLGIAVAANSRSVFAQDEAAEGAPHAVVGAWLVAPRSESGGCDAVLFGADGSVVQGFAANSAGPQGVSYSGVGIGIWEAIDERTVDFTAVSATSGEDGVSTGTVTVNGHLDISEDGQSWVDDNSASTVVIRDKAGAVVLEIADPSAPPVTATRIAVKSPGFPG